MADQYQPPPGPPPEYRYGISQNHQQHVGSGHTGQGTSELGSNNPFRQSRIGARQDSYQPIHGETLPAYQAPPGPPPSWRDDKKTTHGDEYAPLPGPPQIHSGEDNAEPPPYDPWLAVPDNALLPPPPSVFEERSPTANASYDDAARGHAWCRQNPLWQPRPQNQATLSRISTGDLYLTTPPNAHQHISVSAIGPASSSPTSPSTPPPPRSLRRSTSKSTSRAWAATAPRPRKPTPASHSDSSRRRTRPGACPAGTARRSACTATTAGGTSTTVSGAGISCPCSTPTTPWVSG
nr:hypothetical protein CFP56_76535 [Quercus suber]